jgi:hypothetical protein
MPAKILAAARGMAWHLWPALAPEDTLLVSEPPPDGFLESLAELGLTPPRFVTQTGLAGHPGAPAEASRLVLPKPASDLLFTPFGWNAEAMRLNGILPKPAEHPTLDVARLVNSRAFGLELERSLFGDDACPATFCGNGDAVARWLETAPSGRYVAKGNHGHAGIGQMRFTLPSAAEEKLEARLKRLVNRHGGVVFEEEQRIVQEWGLLFRLGRDGRRSPFRVHRLLSEEAGGYVGSLVPAAGETDPLWESQRARAESGADHIAQALYREGYFGPVGLDLYLHKAQALENVNSPEVLQFRLLSDLNARCSMAWPAHGLAARFPGRAILLRQFSTTAMRVFGRQNALPHYRDNLSFDSTRARGAIWLTPLLSLTRHAVAFVGNDGADARNLCDETQKRWGMDR